jgi:lipopolysaccharide/colanic/teichoic acid biosynthesis glycosyltransferase
MKEVCMNANINNINHKFFEQDIYSVMGYSTFSYFIKRVIDLSMASLLLVLTSPISIYAIYRIRKESSGPIFFKQSRVGLQGKTFTCYKFRSMYNNIEFNPYTQEKDPRIFPFGQIMRKYRIDELPQLLNVFKGEMHLIGPRAEWDILVKEYETKIPNYQKRELVRPGITGLAQVYYPYGRNVHDAQQKLNYDLHYIKHWSLWMEIKIMFKTIIVILGKKGV